jgi:hypothetical protein
MSMFAVSGLLLGALIGLRFTVVALIPALLASAAIAGGDLMLGGTAFWPTVAAFGVLGAGLQIGYLAGAGFDFSLEWSRPRRQAARIFGVFNR